eukprot:TRINITY_DN37595_c0_g1_i1.p1 TRINITY_DN37595_c0_g1~~TRINITY_DN37595_c0_g1_i1.p1  ORF type:complete len:447 (+),score=48.42 TRINITY_DN37595_c0_g1_i1:57-1397(+)
MASFVPPTASQTSESSQSSEPRTQTWQEWVGRKSGREGYQPFDLVRGLARHAGAALAPTAEEGRRNIVGMVNRAIRPKLSQQKLPPSLPGPFLEGVMESMDIDLPSSERAWAECFRDLERALEGESVYMLGSGQLYPVHGGEDDHNHIHGDVGQAAGKAAFDRLIEGIQGQMTAAVLCGENSFVSSSSASDTSPADSSSRRSDRSASATAAAAAKAAEAANKVSADPSLLREMSKRAASQISVGPGMQAMLQEGLSPAMWQPLFIVCVGSGQLRVVTCSFIGEPVMGDRPDCKHTPFVLRMVTDDLYSMAVEAQRTTVGVRFAAEHAQGSRSTVEYVARLDAEIFEALETGNWRKLNGEEPATSLNWSPPSRRPSRMRALTKGSDIMDSDSFARKISQNICSGCPTSVQASESFSSTDPSVIAFADSCHSRNLSTDATGIVRELPA